MSNRIANKNVKIGESYVLPLTNSSISKYEAKVESLLNGVEEEKKRLLDDAQTEVDNMKTRAELIIKNAEAKAEEIINNAKNESVKIIKQAESEQEKVKAETENIKKNAYDEGYQKGQEEGLEKFKNDSIDSLKSLDTLAASSFEMKHDIVKSADLDIVELVLAIARKITSHAFDEDMLKEITAAAIGKLKNREQVTIIVNPKLVENIVKLSEDFKQEIAQIQNIKIIEDSALSPDGTIVETPLSRVDSRVSSQIDEIAARLINGIRDDVQEEE